MNTTTTRDTIMNALYAMNETRDAILLRFRDKTIDDRTRDATYRELNMHDERTIDVCALYASTFETYETRAHAFIRAYSIHDKSRDVIDMLYEYDVFRNDIDMTCAHVIAQYAYALINETSTMFVAMRRMNDDETRALFIVDMLITRFHNAIHLRMNATLREYMIDRVLNSCVCDIDFDA